ncbi:tRNA (adenosine(37)-N6)-dimethylallyltransferase MiaA [Chitinivibrio alkaliphilus]|uniref:tRNA dimethylallyltransferase n=1 Tax=Chitinivibrio alkaliphilus ACht1 TaxID=1313304 RepID=U7DA49_9BACT|nr:tRNA (adenosine(37)-N6)-dimethylallyltransferase MiaA [Chitinivibrio alkaliphilus]ERP31315.1 tRNA dimethylallyltransferase [Chitinivibrio alkaliphilus ACht1]
MSEKNNILVLLGPTASGKTSLAVKLAHILGSTIISADSRQVYHGLDLGTGKDLSEYWYKGTAIPYEMIDITEPETVFTLYDYVESAYSILRREQYNHPIVCGGTGLYIEAILRGYKIPNVPENPSFRQRFMEYSKEELSRTLISNYPDLAKNTDLSSSKRIIRALEIGKYRRHSPLRYSSDSFVETHPLILSIEWDRNKLIERIEARIDQRLSEGMVEEVQELISRGIPLERLHLLGLEYRIIGDYISGKYSKERMRELLSIRIRQFAKRQRTWFRGMERRGFTLHPIKEASLREATDVLIAEGWISPS